jgi:hypothetical protein
MTYFGVNYYLSGMHSYAAGDPVPVPSFVYISVILLAALAFKCQWPCANSHGELLWARTLTRTEAAVSSSCMHTSLAPLSSDSHLIGFQVCNFVFNGIGRSSKDLQPSEVHS